MGKFVIDILLEVAVFFLLQKTSFKEKEGSDRK